MHKYHDIIIIVMYILQTLVIGKLRMFYYRKIS